MTRPTPWTYLPNAAPIDEVLTSVKAHPEKWIAAWVAARDAARDAAWVAARDAARFAAWGATQDAARFAAWGATRDAARDAARAAARFAAQDAVRFAAQDAVIALVAYDDAGQFMKLPIEQLKAMHKFDPHPMYLLLQPVAMVFHKG